MLKKNCRPSAAVKIQMIMIDEVKSLLSQKQKIIITTHQRPDGDAIGSSLGLFHFLKKGEHEINFISPTAYPDFLKWMVGNELTIIYEDEKLKCAKLVEEATKPKPNKKWYSVSIEGLIKAAENLDKLGEPVINLSRKVLSLLTGG